ncbi:MAG: 50S ribosomal protein L9 [Alphaproteobacteria bacterium]
MSSSTQVILLERVEKLGQMGEIVNVKPGYARNFLLPQKKALRASKENVAYFEAQKKTLEAANEKGREAAEKLAKTIENVKVPVIRQASEAGQLFGSVNSRDIADSVSEETKQNITRDMVRLTQNIKTIGLIPVEVVLHPEVKVDVIVNIARSVEEAKIQAETGRALIADGSFADVEEEVQEEEILDAVSDEEASDSEAVAEEASEEA